MSVSDSDHDVSAWPVLEGLSDDFVRAHLAAVETERLRARYALAERTQTRLELVISSSIAFASAETEEELAEVLADTMAKAYAAEEAVVFLLNDDGVFEHVAGVNPLEGVDNAAVLALQARELRNVLKISGVAEAYALAPAVGRAFEAAGVQSMVIAPMRQGGDALGILAAFFHHPRTFDDQASPLADAFAAEGARAVTNLRLRAQFEYAAKHDRITGLSNRRHLEENLDQRVRESPSVLGLFFIDLDGFKDVNDQLGHLVGDVLLREVGRRLQATMRADDIVARFGGDEFVVVCEVTDEPTAVEIAERIRAAIAAPYDFLPPHLRLAASIGLSIAPTDHVSRPADHLLRAADHAMYRAKVAGGNRVVTELLAEV